MSVVSVSYLLPPPPLSLPPTHRFHIPSPPCRFPSPGHPPAAPPLRPPLLPPKWTPGVAAECCPVLPPSHGDSTLLPAPSASPLSSPERPPPLPRTPPRTSLPRTPLFASSLAEAPPPPAFAAFSLPNWQKAPPMLSPLSLRLSHDIPKWPGEDTSSA